MKVYEILQGRIYQRGRFDKHSGEAKEDMLLQNNIGMVVGLAGPSDPWLNDWYGIYLYHPISDGLLRPSLVSEIEEEIVRHIITFLRGTKFAVLTYCEAGRNRSSLVNALVLCKFLGISGCEAIEIMKERRPNCFGNLSHVEYLEKI